MGGRWEVRDGILNMTGWATASHCGFRAEREREGIRGQTRVEGKGGRRIRVCMIACFKLSNGFSRVMNLSVSN